MSRRDRQRNDLPPSTDLPPIGPQVRTLLHGLATAIGVGNRCSLTWDRTGAGEFELIAGDVGQWTAERIYGRFGKFSMVLPSEYSIVDPALSYDVIGSDVRLNAECLVRGLADRLSLDKSPAAGVGTAQPVGFGLWSIVSLLPLVWSLLHPRLTLKMPPVIGLDLMMPDAESVILEFTRAPLFVARWVFEFHGQPHRMVLSENGLTIAYTFMGFSRTKNLEW